jgi:DNA-binding Lrp family transcriptional regulator
VSVGAPGPSETDALDRIDRLLLNLLQDDFPVAPRPYAVLAERLTEGHGITLSEDQILSRALALRDKGPIRRLGAILNSRPLGYQSTLCAVAVPPELLEKVAALISARPEVTHNYVRDHELNVWFTFCHHDRARLDEFLTELAAVEGLGAVLELPARKVYKIRAVFELPIPPEDRA